MTTNIQNYSVLGKTATSIKFIPLTYELGSTSVSVVYQLMDSGNAIICNGSVRLTDISDWGTNDSVIVAKVLTALSLTAA
jgi:hypothetical protein